MDDNQQSPKRLTTDTSDRLASLILDDNVSFEAFKKELNETIRLLALERHKHLEAMTCAYFMETDIPVSEVTLVEEHLPDGRIIWYFMKKTDLKGETK